MPSVTHSSAVRTNDENGRMKLFREGLRAVLRITEGGDCEMLCFLQYTKKAALTSS